MFIEWLADYFLSYCYKLATVGVKGFNKAINPHGKLIARTAKTIAILTIVLGATSVMIAIMGIACIFLGETTITTVCFILALISGTLAFLLFLIIGQLLALAVAVLVIVKNTVVDSHVNFAHDVLKSAKHIVLTILAPVATTARLLSGAFPGLSREEVDAAFSQPLTELEQTKLIPIFGELGETLGKITHRIEKIKPAVGRIFTMYSIFLIVFLFLNWWVKFGAHTSGHWLNQAIVIAAVLTLTFLWIYHLIDKQDFRLAIRKTIVPLLITIIVVQAVNFWFVRDHLYILEDSIERIWESIDLKISFAKTKHELATIQQEELKNKLFPLPGATALDSTGNVDSTISLNPNELLDRLKKTSIDGHSVFKVRKVKGDNKQPFYLSIFEVEATEVADLTRMTAAPKPQLQVASYTPEFHQVSASPARQYSQPAVLEPYRPKEKVEFQFWPTDTSELNFTGIIPAGPEMKYPTGIMVLRGDILYINYDGQVNSSTKPRNPANKWVGPAIGQVWSEEETTNKKWLPRDDLPDRDGRFMELVVYLIDHVTGKIQVHPPYEPILVDGDYEIAFGVNDTIKKPWETFKDNVGGYKVWMQIHA